MDPDKLVLGLSSAPARRILAACVSKAQSAREIEVQTSLPHSTVYRLLNELAADGLVQIERSALTSDGKRYELYRSRIRTARIQFDSMGVHITWEPMESTDERTARIWRLV